MPPPRWILGHPTGNMNVRQNALALAEAGMLKEFWTCLNFDVSKSPWKSLPAGLKQKVGRRSFSLPSEVEIKTSPWQELGRHLVAALGIRSEVGSLFSVDGVYRALDRRIAADLNDADPAGWTGVFASEDGALESFRTASQMGKARVYELPIGYWRAAREILGEEAQRKPEWALTLTGNNDPPEKLKRKDEELALATGVLVASSFTRKTLRMAPGCPENILVLPYMATDGSPLKEQARFCPRNPDAPLKVVYVGSLTQRKGLSYLLDAIASLGSHVELTLVGREAAPGCRPLEAALVKHRWKPSLPHAAILEEMSRHDVLVLPSLFEGFGLVLVEALAQGLPIIATDHTGAPDIIEDNIQGFVVPVRDAIAIEEKLEFLVRNPAKHLAMRHAALDRASNLKWSTYRRSLVNWLHRC